jgi:circadian clock protein KaiC
MKIQSPYATVTKIPTGIRGFDEVTDGGLPGGRTTLVMGGPGCGKTVFALQTLVNGALRDKEASLFVAFEENTHQIIANAATFGWDLPALVRKKLFFLDAHLSPDVVKAGEFDLVGMLAVLQAKAKQLHAKRVVFDGIDVLLTLLNDPVAERRELYRIRDWLTETGLTGIITQKVGGSDADQRYGFLQFMVDCVVILQHQVVDGSAFRSLRVKKFRGSGFAGDDFPITLTQEGLQLTNRGPMELQYDVTDERISTGLPRLDNMLRGGYHRGSNVLISGAPGTAKSTLCGLFAAAACRRGERTLYVSFDEGAAQIVRNLRSVGIRLAPHQKSGVLKIYSTRTRGPNVEDQFGALRALVSAHRPRCLVVDPHSRPKRSSGGSVTSSMRRPPRNAEARGHRAMTGESRNHGVTPRQTVNRDSAHPCAAEPRAGSERAGTRQGRASGARLVLGQRGAQRPDRPGRTAREGRDRARPE